MPSKAARAAYNRKRRADPAKRRADNEAFREARNKRRADHLQLGTIDLRFLDPERYAKLVVYSCRGEPVTPVRAANPQKRVHAAQQPTLFAED